MTFVRINTYPPVADIISVELLEKRLPSTTVNLSITCHVDSRDQPFPRLHTFIIQTETGMESNSSSLILSPRPEWCMNVTCIGQNDYGSTSSIETYCPRDDVIEVKLSEYTSDDNVTVVVILCHVTEEYQPHPDFHQYVITADNLTLSRGRSPWVYLGPKPEKCVSVTCSALNDFGFITASENYCPTDYVHVTGILQTMSTTYALLIVLFVLAVVVCVVTVMQRKKDTSKITGGTSVTLEVPSPLTPNQEVTAVLRLVGGADEHEGRVEILCDGVWGTACDYGWGDEEGNAVCRQLGYSSVASVHHNAHFGQGSGPIWLDYGIYCPTSDKNSLLECYRGPWGCYASYGGGTSWGHSNDVGVRCAGERNLSAAAAIFANADLNEGLTYGIDRFTYYDMTSRLTFTPTTANHGDTLQCHVYGVVRSATLEVTGGVDVPRSITPCITPSPGTPPGENILSIDAVEIKGENNLVTLVISCHVNLTDQPSPYLHTYTIGTETTTLSSSSSGSAILSPRPNACIELTCSATNGIGTTSATLTHCPRDKPPERIISVSFETQEAAETSLIITCQVDPADQPFPPINTYLIAVDDSVISDSASPTVTIDAQPNTCIDVVCTGINEYGETEMTKTYCPPQLEAGPEQPGSNILRIQTTEIRGEGNLVTLIITCHVDLSDQPYPHLHTYTITADNDTLSSSSCASAILSPLPDACINVTCSATNGIGDTLSWMEHCRTEIPSGGPIASPHRRVLQQSSTTYALLVVVFILSIITCFTVLVKRKNVF
ncbi:uncharacterized protein [Diadema setosum]|uniref:uncharacterized protein n=1 Tax=Diadema setosum TaxID=31175 RepID=UPI003B3B4D3B